LKKPTEFFLEGIKTKLDEGVGRILLGNNTGRRGGHSATNWVTARWRLDFSWTLTYMYVYSWPHVHLIPSFQTSATV